MTFDEDLECKQTDQLVIVLYVQCVINKILQN